MTISISVYATVDGKDNCLILNGQLKAEDTVSMEAVYTVCKDIENDYLTNKEHAISNVLIALVSFKDNVCDGNTTFCSMRSYKERTGELPPSILHTYV